MRVNDVTPSWFPFNKIWVYLNITTTEVQLPLQMRGQG
jgi:hypothetical protein